MSDPSKTGDPLDPARGSTIPPEPSTKLTTGDGITELSPNRWDPKNFNQDREAFRQQTVHFEFDKSTIRSEDYDKIQAVAAFLKNETGAMVEVEGHCDERGTSEYNRALGERRALAIREYLIGLGIIGERVSTISFGEDQPADSGHDESAWGKNRRGVFVLLRPRQ